MSRPWRIQFPGASYHVISRGNARGDIVVDDRDRERWVKLLGDAAARFSLEVFAFCLMNNHFHIFLSTREPNLSRAMHWLNTSYTVYYNRRHQRPGHLLQGRYRAVLVERGAHWSHLSIYIHLNPVRAGLCSDPIDYPWSSFRDYVCKRPSRKWMKRDRILAEFGPGEGRLRYGKACREMIEARREVWDDLKKASILGSEEFKAKVKMDFLKAAPDPELPSQIALARSREPGKLLIEVAAKLETQPEALRKRKWAHVKKDMAVAMLKKIGILSNRQIAELLWISPSAVTHASYRHNQRLSEDITYQKDWIKYK